MAGFITLSEDNVWSSGNWVYWGLMKHLIAAFSTDEATKRKLVTNYWMHGLSFPLLQESNPEMVEPIRAKLLIVAKKAVKGELPCSVEGRGVLDEDLQRQFREAISELVDMMEAAK